ncbi:unnamed protein product, partial [Discosporangium mesarthrocarpum]
MTLHTKHSFTVPSVLAAGTMGKCVKRFGTGRLQLLSEKQEEALRRLEDKSAKIWCPEQALDDACVSEPRLAEAIRLFEETRPRAEILYLAYAGSRLHGTESPLSDLDVKGIYHSPSRRKMARKGKAKKRREGDVGLGEAKGKDLTPRGAREKYFQYSTSDSKKYNTKDDIDVELISFSLFLSKIRRGAINEIEVLF